MPLLWQAYQYRSAFMIFKRFFIDYLLNRLQILQSYFVSYIRILVLIASSITIITEMINENRLYDKEALQRMQQYDELCV